MLVGQFKTASSSSVPPDRHHPNWNAKLCTCKGKNNWYICGIWRCSLFYALVTPAHRFTPHILTWESIFNSKSTISHCSLFLQQFSMKYVHHDFIFNNGSGFLLLVFFKSGLCQMRSLWSDFVLVIQILLWVAWSLKAELLWHWNTLCS